MPSPSPSVDLDGTPTTQSMIFGQLRIDFDARVLRPRIWTLSQSAWAAELATHAPAGPVLELCAGAGQIGLLACADAGRDLVLVDSDDVACGYAKANARHAGLAERVAVRQKPVHDAVTPGERFAVIIADPPWVPSDTVADHPDDPVHAIDGGTDGLAVTWECLDVISAHLAHGGSAVIQLGSATQVRTVHARLAADPHCGLNVVAVRSYDGHGMLALVRHAAGAMAAHAAV